MGSVNFGAPRDIILKVGATFQVATFVETGTYLGGTASWASAHFQRVFTIEGSPDFHRQAQENHRNCSNIEYLLGDSRSKLSEVLMRLGDSPALFWLDAHWMPGSFGQAHECPLLEELETIGQSTGHHFILIDDARLFLAPPPLPHRARDWPDIGSILSALKRPGHPPSYTVVLDDVIISVPDSARETMEQFYQEQTTAAAKQASLPSSSPASGILRRIKRRLRTGIAGK